MRTRLPLGVFALALGSLLGEVPLLAGEGDLATRRFDVGTLVHLRREAQGPILGAGAPHLHGQEQRPGPGALPFLDPGELTDLVRTFVEPASWDQEGASWDVVGRWLVVRNREGVLDRVAAFLAALEAEARRGLTVAVEVREAPAAAWPAGGEGASLLESGSLALPFGLTESLRDTNRVTFVADYNVEIAQGSNISRPSMTTAEAGLVVDAVAHPTTDGRRAVLELLVQRAQYGPSRFAETGVDEEYLAQPYRSNERKGNGRIELPVYDHLQAHLTAVVEAGGTFSVPFLHRGRLLEVRGRVLGLSAPALGQPTLSLGALGHRPWSLAFALPEEDAWWQDRLAPRLRFLGTQAEAPAGDAEYVVEGIRSSVERRFWDEMGGNLSLGAGGRLVVEAPEDVREKVRAHLAALETQVLRPVEIELRVFSVPGVPATGAGATVPAQGARLVAAGRLATLSGRAASLLGGSTANVVAGYDVEVAQEARIGDPLIGQAFDGLVVNCTPRITGDGATVALEIQLLRSSRKIDPQPFETGARYLGPIDAVTSHRALVDGILEIPANGTHVVDLGRDPDDAGRRVALEVAATLR